MEKAAVFLDRIFNGTAVRHDHIGSATFCLYPPGYLRHQYDVVGMQDLYALFHHHASNDANVRLDVPFNVVVGEFDHGDYVGKLLVTIANIDRKRIT